MTSPTFDNPRWPNSAQRLLLHAAFDDGAAAADAWRQWVAAGGLDEPVDHASYEILPLVMTNLAARGVEIAEAGVLRGLHRRTWYQNRMMLARVAHVVETFNAAGVPSMLLKGGALLSLYYRDARQRAMLDIDLLIHREHTDRAFELLLAAGWVHTIRREKSLARIRRFMHGTAFRSGEMELDLHWDVMMESRPAGTESELWARAEPVAIEGAPTLAIGRVDLLIHVIVHSYRWAPSASLRWITDVMAILGRDGSPLDWDLLVAQAQRMRVTLMVERSLRYVATELGAPVPEQALERLARTRRGPLERLHYRANDAAPGVLNSALLESAYYLRVSAGRPLRRRALDAPAYFQLIWRVRSPWGLPREVARRVRHKRRELRPAPGSVERR